ncbi:hypothetical protein IKO18_00715 [bacterium]|jgi:hypothetical protein|nr:hypothetical protein [bacterium]
MLIVQEHHLTTEQKNEILATSLNDLVCVLQEIEANREERKRRLKVVKDFFSNKKRK